MEKEYKIFQSKLGMLIQGNSLELLTNDDELRKLKGRINLIVTSPPFPLNNKKQYGNTKGEEYLKWFTELAPIFLDIPEHVGSSSNLVHLSHPVI